MVSDRSLSVAMMFFVGLFAMVFLMGLTGCTKDPQQTNIEVIQDMMVQPSVKAQDVNPHTGKSGMLVPPEGTAAINREVYLYKDDPQAAAEKLVNPNSSDSVEALELGERHFKNYCYVCHGEQGKGDGPVAGKFIGIKPPSLLSDKVRGMKDGQIFDIITDGQGVMGAYINQMPWNKDRWAVVTYVRKLQKDIQQ